MRFRSDDNVLIIKGRDRGKQGRIQHILHSKNKVLVEGVNIVKKHQKPAQGVRQGGIIQKELPIPSANVMLVCTHCSEPTRIGYKYLADGTKARVCRKCEEVIE